MKLIRYILFLLLFCSINSRAQEPAKQKFWLGTELTTFISGTPNLSFSYHWDKLSLKVGGGLTPFGYFLDLNNWRPGENLPILDEQVSLGYHYNAQINWAISPEKTIKPIDAFYYARHQFWHYTFESDYHVDRFKVQLGLGHLINLNERFQLEMRYGIGIGQDKFTYIGDMNYEEGEVFTKRNYLLGYNKERQQSKLLLFLCLGAELKFAL